MNVSTSANPNEALAALTALVNACAKNDEVEAEKAARRANKFTECQTGVDGANAAVDGVDVAANGAQAAAEAAIAAAAAAECRQAREDRSVPALLQAAAAASAATCFAASVEPRPRRVRR